MLCSCCERGSCLVLLASIHLCFSRASLFNITGSSSVGSLVKKKKKTQQSDYLFPHTTRRVSNSVVNYSIPISLYILAECLNTHYSIIAGNVEPCFLWLRKYLKYDNSIYIVLVSAI